MNAAMLYPEDTGVGGTAVLTLKNIHDGNNQSTFSYGAFYASLNRRIAGSYAVNNPFGSELLTCIDATISALRHHEVANLDRVLAQYPALTSLLAASHRPVVLVLQGVPIEHLLSENGGPFGEHDIAVYEELSSLGGRVPGSVRVNGPISSYIGCAYRIYTSAEAPKPGGIQDEDVRFEECPIESLLNEFNYPDHDF